MAQSLRNQISSLEADLTAYPKMPETNPQKWLSNLQFARSAITSVDHSPLLVNQLGTGPWLRLIYALQKLAYQNPDTGGEVDIALWCERQWATEVQRQPSNTAALQGQSLTFEVVTSPILQAPNLHKPSPKPTPKKDVQSCLQHILT